MSAPILFDAVIFDLDGTLVATDRFWVAAAGEGARRAFAELGLERDPPSAAQWMEMVGLPLEAGFAHVFADLDEARRRHVMLRCVEAEHEALRAGGAALLPGARELLVELRSRGLKLGIASNCGRDYLDAVLDGLGLRALVDEARCLDSRGVRHKSDMLRDLLATFGTRSAAMVGDRAGDARAAHDNALPHIHIASGFAPEGERVEAEATVGGLGEVLGVLEERGASFERHTRAAGLLARSPRGRTIAITGPMGAGKSIAARDLVRVLAAHGVEATAIALDAFLRPEPDAAAEEHLERAFDVERLLGAVLEPRLRGEPTRHGPWGPPVPREHALVVEGLFLLHPRVRVFFDFTLYLQVSDELAVARVAARGTAMDELIRVRRVFLPAQREFEARIEPAGRSDLVLDGSNPLRPLP